jgi:hypothetical protein
MNRRDQRSCGGFPGSEGLGSKRSRPQTGLGAVVHVINPTKKGKSGSIQIPVSSKRFYEIGIRRITRITDA